MSEEPKKIRCAVPFYEKDVATANVLTRKLMECDTSAPWSIDLSEDEFHFILGILLSVVETTPEGMALASCPVVDGRDDDVREMTIAARDVLAERRRQVEVEGWTAERDDEVHARGELAMAAAGYAWFAGAGDHARTYLQDWSRVPRDWPWNPCWFKPTTPRRDLVKSAALALAEIERLDRAEAKGDAP